jgi:ribonuclease I
MSDWKCLNAAESDFDFWKRQWDSHGKCAIDRFKPIDTYFIAALRANGGVDIMRRLANRNIFPDNTRMYTTDKFFEAIKDEGLSKPQIECEAYNDSELREIRFCYTPGMSMVDCPFSSLNLRCRTQFKWPSQ